jgi:hypothetical protein
MELVLNGPVKLLSFIGPEAFCVLVMEDSVPMCSLAVSDGQKGGDQTQCPLAH